MYFRGHLALRSLPFPPFPIIQCNEKKLFCHISTRGMVLPCNYSFGLLLSHLPNLSRRGLLVASYHERKLSKIKIKRQEKNADLSWFKLQGHNVQPTKSQNTTHTTLMQLHHEETVNQAQFFPVVKNLNMKKLHFLCQGRCRTSTTKYVCIHSF